MKLLDSKTYFNLAKSYAGECQARVRYEFMEYCARNEGLKQLAILIDKVVYNEFNHARMFYTKIQDASDNPIKNIDICTGYPFKEKWDLLDALEFAVEDEQTEVEIYKSFAKTAKEEGFMDIALLFENVSQVENCHAMRFKEIHKQLKNGSMYRKPKAVKWKCGDCGYEATGKEAWKICPLCQAKQGSVMLIFDEE
ncbi:MAG: rubrerythrin family protein [Clostridiales bacterium]|nr:rubrerythrin family protein [Clostridiales bacterium]